MEHHRAELKLNFGVKLQIILLIKTKWFMFVSSVSINSNSVQQDGILESNFPANTSPSHIQRYLDFIQALTKSLLHFHLAFISPFFTGRSIFFFPSGLSLKSDLWLINTVFLLSQITEKRVTLETWCASWVHRMWNEAAYHLRWLYWGHATYLTNRKAIAIPACFVRQATSWADPLLHVILNFLTLIKTFSWDLCVCPSCLRAALFRYFGYPGVPQHKGTVIMQTPGCSY